MVETKEIAKELLQGILPKIKDLQQQIDNLDRKIDGLEGRVQTLSSILMNKRKHRKD